MIVPFSATAFEHGEIETMKEETGEICRMSGPDFTAFWSIFSERVFSTIVLGKRPDQRICEPFYLDRCF